MSTTVSKRGKIDYKKEFKELYQPSAKEVAIVTVPKMDFLMIDGQGEPGVSQAFLDATGALYPLAYTIKFMVKAMPDATDYVVPPLEGLWWADDMTAFGERRYDEWKWTLMIMQPPSVTKELFDKAFAQVKAKKVPAALARVRFEAYDEGKCVQIMHIGPFDQEGPTLEKAHAKVQELGKKLRLKHHEIYLSDPCRTAPERLKTVLRQPFG